MAGKKSKFINNNLFNRFRRESAIIRMLDGSIEETRRLEEEREIYYHLKNKYGEIRHYEYDDNQLGLIASIIASWKGMNTQQKIIAVIMVLVVSGVTFAIAYNLLPYIMTLFNEARAEYDCILSRRSLAHRSVVSRHQIEYTSRSSSLPTDLQAKSAAKGSKKSPSTWSNPIAIRCDSDLIETGKKLELSAPEESKKLRVKVIKKLAQIDELIPQLSFHSDAIYKLADSNLKITVIDSDLFSKITGSIVARGMYSCELHTIYIPLEITQIELRTVLQNELFHALTKVANLNRMQLDNLPCDDEHPLSYPFLNKEGKPHLPAIQSLQTAVDEYRENSLLFAKLYELEMTQKEIPYKHHWFYQDLKESILNHYKPKVHCLSLSPESYSSLEAGIQKGILLQSKKNPSLFLMKRKQFPGLELSHDYWVDASSIIQTNEGEYIVQCKIAGDGSQKPLLKIFIEDTKIMLNDYSLIASEKAPLAEVSYYQSLSHNQHLTEFSSEIQTIANEIKTFLCPTWCHYFSEYFEVDNYCVPPIRVEFNLG